MVTCPKCSSTSAWLSCDRVDVTLRCLCGYNKVVASRLIVMEDKSGNLTLKLPAKGSNLFKTLMALYELQEADSSGIAARMSDELCAHKSRDVASYLYVLKSKGFVTQAEARKRLAGGSLWRVTEAAEALLKQ
jgi:hypothetical protein